MFDEKIKNLINASDYVFVATANAEGVPHLATGRELRIESDGYLVFENWFCQTTLENAAQNPLVAIAITDPKTGCGYQLIGIIVKSIDSAILNGYAPDVEGPGSPQTLISLRVRVDNIMMFCAGTHSDLSIAKR